ncbi:MAG: hypothetical protein ETSY1_18680 [Candidatus Entotheonella factor]|uniref:HTH tetR-type domain-containing protein n=1 Tax=Entotheonella factor TaxID=1429438 RepID=W4LKL5_ENTF1|nr:MAG: hypothetical protein ETSY1_18680 [Candidatus Entotheonella factor]
MSEPEREAKVEVTNPRARRRQRARRAFLDAARRMIAEHGPAGLSLREVARQADYSPAALYEYFDSREALLAVLIQEGFDALNQAILAVSTEYTPREQLKHIGLAYVNFARRQPQTFELLFSYHVNQRKQLDEEAKYGNNHYAFFRSAVTKVIPEASERKVELVSYSFWALVHGLAMLQITYLQHFDADFDRVNAVSLESFINDFAESGE